MTTVNSYLTFNGNCLEAFEWYKSVFGGEFNYVGRYSDMPEGEGFPVSPGEENRIMHISLPISQETTLMGCDTGGETASNFISGNNFSIFITAESKGKADELFNSLSASGQVSMPMSSMFWGDYFGMLTDRFGINWMVSFNEEFMQQ